MKNKQRGKSSSLTVFAGPLGVISYYAKNKPFTSSLYSPVSAAIPIIISYVFLIISSFYKKFGKIWRVQNQIRPHT